MFQWLPTLLVLGISLANQVMIAQTPCATDEMARRNLQRFPDLAVRRINVLAATPEGLLYPDQPAQVRTVVTIPIVVHVVYKGGLDNISDAQIQSQMDVLNADYRLLNPNAANLPAEFLPLAADMEVEFCLARQDPSGQATIGITRTLTDWFNIGQLTAADGSPRICYTALGGHDAWDTEHYLNIWVASIGGGILGIATLPGTAPAAEDGVILDYRHFGTVGLAALNPPHHLGRTATHEIGHYLGLQHIWGGEENLCTDDDGVSDTPVQRAAYLGCPSYPQFSCGNSAMFMNYMDYTDDACLALFTHGQKARMWATLTVARPGLLTSQGCVATAVNSPTSPLSLRLYPNPAFEAVTIVADGGFKAGPEVVAWDVWGRNWPLTGTVNNQDVLTVQIAGLPAGVYLLQIKTSDGSSRWARLLKN